MLYSIKDREGLENLNELASLQDQMKAVRLQDKLGKQNFHEDVKKIFEPVTKSLENTSQDVTKTITETSIKNNQAIINNEVVAIIDVFLKNKCKTKKQHKQILIKYNLLQ